MERSRSPVKPLLEGVGAECRLPAADRGLAMNIVYGVLRQRQYLECLIGRLCRHPRHKLDPFILHSLEVGLFQLLCLDRIPQSAAVNETVQAAKAAGLPQRLQGFVNGILRESIRQRATLPEIDTDPQSGRPWLNHPTWLTNRWRQRFGEDEMRRICASNNEEPTLVLKINTTATTREQYRMRLDAAGIACRDGLFAPQALALPACQGAIPLLPGYGEGHFLVQDEATQLAPLLLGPFRPGGRYLDACAGLGGKTGTLIEQEQDLGLRITAIEPDAYRYRKLGENLQRLYPGAGCTTRQCTLQDVVAAGDGPFDGILVDAPCSGTGVTGRHPDIRWNRTEEDLVRYQALQLELLDQAAALTAAGGVLVYATCSLEPEENEEVIRQFLERHDQFQLTAPGPLLPPAAGRFVEDRFFCPRPDATIDGFFAARLVRR